VRFYLLTLFPELFEGYRNVSILGRAQAQGQVELQIVNIRDHARDRHRTCDDYTYGGGAGMLLKPGPLAEALEALPGVRVKTAETCAVSPSGLNRVQGCPRVIFLTPSGRLWRQEMAQALSAEEQVVLVCGRYEGVDQRVVDLFVTDEISVGDYVLGGGEVAAMVVVDTVARLIKGVIKEDSLAEESFRKGLLEYPQYTRPAEFRGLKVPEVLLSGHHAEIQRWRLRKSIEKTLRNRPELIDSKRLSPEAGKALEEVRDTGEDDGQDQGR
jgi:tRNA (guanine37-N1)-methyltransferase